MTRFFGICLLSSSTAACLAMIHSSPAAGGQPATVLHTFAVPVAFGATLVAEQPQDDKLAALERFVGEWVVDGKWATGEVLQARSVYAWGLGKKIITAKTFVKNGDKEYQRYEGIMAWHPQKKSLYEISFAFDGSITEVMIDIKDKDTLHFGYTPFTEGKPSSVRQVTRFLSKDSFQWVVSVREGDNWKQLIDATWKRK